MRNKTKNFLSIGLGLLILAVLAYLAGPETISHLKEISVYAIFGSILVYGFSWILRAERLQFILSENSPSFGKIFSLNLGGYAGNILLPVKAGDVLRALSLNRTGVGKPESFMAILYTRLQDLLAVIGMLLLFLPAVWFLEFSKWFFVPIGLGVLFLAMFMIFVIMGAEPLKPYFRMVEKAVFERLFDEDYEITSEAFTVLDSYLRPKFTLSVLFRSLGIWALEVFSAYVIAASIVPSISLNLIFVAVSFGNIAKIVPATPGGVGLYEGAVASVLSVSGVSYSVAFTIALVEHTLKNTFIVVLGSYFFSREGLNVLQPHL